MKFCYNFIRRQRGDSKVRSRFMLLCLILLILPGKSDGEPNNTKPFVYLNHVYVTLDSATYSSVGNSDFLKDIFSSCITKTVAADSGQSWTGTYVWGENTYIEFFNIGEYENKGYSGIGFGVEVENGIEHLYKQFTDSGITNVWKDVRYRQVDDQEVPWFEMFGFLSEDTAARFITNTWAMEYKNEYMISKYPDRDPESLEITRKCYNQKEYRSDLLLKDIVEVELAVDDPDYSKLLDEFKNYGYQIEQNGASTVANGPDIRVILRAKSEKQAGICRIKFSLTDKRYEQQTEIFSNKSKLILNSDKTADWYFDIQ